ncbi:MAG: hypothetical protein ACLGIR_05845 [Actinomycetes bacterium]
MTHHLRPDGVTADQDALRARLAPPAPTVEAPVLVLDPAAVDDPGHPHTGVLLGALLRAALGVLEQDAPVTSVSATLHRIPALADVTAGAAEPVVVVAAAMDRTTAEARSTQPARGHGAPVAELTVEAAGHAEVMRAGDLLDLARRVDPDTPELDVAGLHGPCVVCGWQADVGLGLAPRDAGPDAAALLWIPPDATSGGDRDARRRRIPGSRRSEPETLVGVWALLAVLPCAARWAARGALGTSTISSCTGVHAQVLSRPEAYTPLRVVAALDEDAAAGPGADVRTRVAVVDDEDVVHVVATVTHAHGSR